ncbi:hypothetical protein [Paraurantiacibacter namhicola]|uniref:Uncharacterized protein n=1 Tax=Paraurantiacibacter namhicola TaxID=645517 RepID=A0A1C7D5E7_9SPHN|nr:hypothetical protein [Paraurantiacibacter namhicola]ANU06690.1 hypothetical protein A6F65_00365 [Paraurantiacibacter namhicola]
MFEGRFPFAGLGPGADDAVKPVAADALVRLEWDVLKARLGAARELRGALGHEAWSGTQEGMDDASFDPRSARKLHAHGDGKQPFNLDFSADGKPVGDTILPSDAAAPKGMAQNPARSGDPRI